MNSKRITNLPPDHIFVFGSNRAGRHGKGAASDAVNYFNAVYGKGEGFQGRSYAIPTKDEQLRALSLEEIKKHVRNFLEFAAKNQHLTFVLTPIGCGLAGYDPEEIAPMFISNVRNILLPPEFKKVI